MGVVVVMSFMTYGMQSVAQLNSLKEVAKELNQTADTSQVVPREGDFASVMRGSKVFSQNCASCHGKGAVGAPNWQVRDAAGNFPPPPLNGTAHAWHHPKAQLRDQIRNGSQIMPPFGAVLSDEQIVDVIHWFQSFWPDELYGSWAQRNESYERSVNQ